MSNSISAINPLQVSDLMTMPLVAACDAQQKLSKTSIDFINNICLTETRDETGKIISANVNTVNFSFQDGTTNKQITVPLISLLNVPSLNISEVDVNFNIAINSVSVSDNTVINNTSRNTNNSLDFRNVSNNIVTQSSYNTNAFLTASNTKTDALNATYSVHIKAKSILPIGLTKIIDILNNCNSVTYSNT